MHVTFCSFSCCYGQILSARKLHRFVSLVTELVQTLVLAYTKEKEWLHIKAMLECEKLEERASLTIVIFQVF
jgi:hypothetical protein